MIHWRLASESPRSCWIDGSATFTTVASSTTMNCAKHTSTRTTQRFVDPRLSAITASPATRLQVAETVWAASRRLVCPPRAQTCNRSRDFMLRGSPLHHSTCGLCAEACERCAESCERFDDDTMRRCAEEC